VACSTPKLFVLVVLSSMNLHLPKQKTTPGADVNAIHVSSM